MRKAASLTLALFYFCTQVVLCHASETNFWKERRATSSRNGSMRDPESFQLASLPAPSSPKFVIGDRASSTTLDSRLKHSGMTYKNVSPRLRTVIEALPLNQGTVQDVYDSRDLKTAPVVLIQDVHMNLEAQNNIAALIQNLINQKQVGMVGVEAAFDPFDFSQFRGFDKKITKDVADAFLAKNKISAAPYVGITSEINPPAFVGIDSLEPYKANVKAYLSTVKIKDSVKKEIADQKKELAAQKIKVFSAELKNFDDLRTAYHDEKIGLGEYVKKLSVIPAKAGIQSSNSLLKNDDNLDPRLRGDDDLAIDQFLAAYEMEKSLDFTRVDAERKTVLEKLTQKLKQNELNDLMEQSVAYRMGRLSFGVYYQNLKDLCESKGISLKNTPAFDNYIRYVLLSDGIKVDQLFAAIDQLEQNLLDTLAKTPKEKSLADQSEHLSLTDKLVEFALTPSEWEKYKGVRSAQSVVRSVETTHYELRTTDLKPFEQFYEQADIRSHNMVGNLLRTTDFALRTSVLVVGGFHTPQIADLLKKQKISYVVVSPKITKLDDSGSTYLTVFTREKTSIDLLFKGEKLFLGSVTNNAVGTNIPSVLKTQEQIVAAEKAGNPNLEDDSLLTRRKVLTQVVVGAVAVGLRNLLTMAQTVTNKISLKIFFGRHTGNSFTDSLPDLEEAIAHAAKNPDGSPNISYLREMILGPQNIDLIVRPLLMQNGRPIQGPLSSDILKQVIHTVKTNLGFRNQMEVAHSKLLAFWGDSLILERYKELAEQEKNKAQKRFYLDTISFLTSKKIDRIYLEKPTLESSLQIYLAETLFREAINFLYLGNIDQALKTYLESVTTRVESSRLRDSLLAQRIQEIETAKPGTTVLHMRGSAHQANAQLFSNDKVESTSKGKPFPLLSLMDPKKLADNKSELAVALFTMLLAEQFHNLPESFAFELADNLRKALSSLKTSEEITAWILKLIEDVKKANAPNEFINGLVRELHKRGIISDTYYKQIFAAPPASLWHQVEKRKALKRGETNRDLSWEMIAGATMEAIFFGGTGWGLMHLHWGPLFLSLTIIRAIFVIRYFKRDYRLALENGERGSPWRHIAWATLYSIPPLALLGAYAHLLSDAQIAFATYHQGFFTGLKSKHIEPVDAQRAEEKRSRILQIIREEETHFLEVMPGLKGKNVAAHSQVAVYEHEARRSLFFRVVWKPFILTILISAGIYGVTGFSYAILYLIPLALFLDGFRVTIKLTENMLGRVGYYSLNGVLILAFGNMLDDNEYRRLAFHEISHHYFPVHRLFGKQIAFIASYLDLIRRIELGTTQFRWDQTSEFVNEVINQYPISKWDSIFLQKARQVDPARWKILYSIPFLEPAYSYSYGQMLALAAYKHLDGRSDQIQAAYRVGRLVAEGSSFEKALQTVIGVSKPTLTPASFFANRAKREALKRGKKNPDLFWRTIIGGSLEALIMGSSGWSLLQINEPSLFMMLAIFESSLKICFFILDYEMGKENGARASPWLHIALAILYSIPQLYLFTSILHVAADTFIAFYNRTHPDRQLVPASTIRHQALRKTKIDQILLNEVQQFFDNPDDVDLNNKMDKEFKSTKSHEFQSQRLTPLFAKMAVPVQTALKIINAHKIAVVRLPISLIEFKKIIESNVERDLTIHPGKEGNFLAIKPGSGFPILHSGSINLHIDYDSAESPPSFLRYASINYGHSHPKGTNAMPSDGDEDLYAGSAFSLDGIRFIVALNSENELEATVYPDQSKDWESFKGNAALPILEDLSIIEPRQEILFIQTSNTLPLNKLNLFSKTVEHYFPHLRLRNLMARESNLSKLEGNLRNKNIRLIVVDPSIRLDIKRALNKINVSVPVVSYEATTSNLIKKIKTTLSKKVSPKGKPFSFKHHQFALFISLVLGSSLINPQIDLLASYSIGWVILGVWAFPIGIMMLLTLLLRIFSKSSKNELDKEVVQDLNIWARGLGAKINWNLEPESQYELATTDESSGTILIAKWLVEKNDSTIYSALRTWVLRFVKIHEKARLNGIPTFFIFLFKPVMLLEALWDYLKSLLNLFPIGVIFLRMYSTQPTIATRTRLPTPIQLGPDDDLRFKQLYKNIPHDDFENIKGRAILQGGVIHEITHLEIKPTFDYSMIPNEVRKISEIKPINIIESVEKNVDLTSPRPFRFLAEVLTGLVSTVLAWGASYASGRVAPVDMMTILQASAIVAGIYFAVLGLIVGVQDQKFSFRNTAFNLLNGVFNSPLVHTAILSGVIAVITAPLMALLGFPFSKTSLIAAITLSAAASQWILITLAEQDLKKGTLPLSDEEIQLIEQKLELLEARFGLRLKYGVPVEVRKDLLISHLLGADDIPIAFADNLSRLGFVPFWRGLRYLDFNRTRDSVIVHELWHAFMFQLGMSKRKNEISSVRFFLSLATTFQILHAIEMAPDYKFRLNQVVKNAVSVDRARAFKNGRHDALVRILPEGILETLFGQEENYQAGAWLAGWAYQKAIERARELGRSDPKAIAALAFYLAFQADQTRSLKMAEEKLAVVTLHEVMPLVPNRVTFTQSLSLKDNINALNLALNPTQSIVGPNIWKPILLGALVYFLSGFSGIGQEQPTPKQTVNKPLSPASIRDQWAKEKWGDKSLGYYLYTLFGVWWEIIYQLPIVATVANSILNRNGRHLTLSQIASQVSFFTSVALPITMHVDSLMLIGLNAVLWALSSAVLFSEAHPDRTPWQKIYLGLVGFGLAGGFITPILLHSNLQIGIGLAIVVGIITNFILHTLFNAAALFFGWRPASMRSTWDEFQKSMQKNGWGVVDTRSMRVSKLADILAEAYDKIYNFPGAQYETGHRFAISGFSENKDMYEINLDADSLAAVKEWAETVLANLQKAFPNEPLEIANVTLGRGWSVSRPHVDNRGTYLHATNTVRGASTYFYPHAANFENGAFDLKNIGEPLIPQTGETAVISGTDRRDIVPGVVPTMHSSPLKQEGQLEDRITLFLGIRNKNWTIEFDMEKMRRVDSDMKYFEIRSKQNLDLVERQKLVLEGQKILTKYKNELSDSQRKLINGYINKNVWPLLPWYLPMLKSENPIEQEIALRRMADEIEEFPASLNEALPQIVNLAQSSHNSTVRSTAISTILSLSSQDEITYELIRKEFANPKADTSSIQRITRAWQSVVVSGIHPLSTNDLIALKKGLALNDRHALSIIEILTYGLTAKKNRLDSSALNQDRNFLARLVQLSVSSNGNFKTYAMLLHQYLAGKISLPQYKESFDQQQNIDSVLRTDKKTPLSKQEKQDFQKILSVASSITKVISEEFEHGAQVIQWGRDALGDHRDYLTDVLTVIEQNGVKTIALPVDELSDIDSMVDSWISLSAAKSQRKIIHDFLTALMSLNIEIIPYSPEDMSEDLKVIPIARKIEQSAHKGRVLILGQYYDLSRTPIRDPEGGYEFPVSLGVLLSGEPSIKSIFIVELDKRALASTSLPRQDVSDLFDDIKQSIGFTIADSPLAKHYIEQNIENKFGESFDVFLYRTKNRGGWDGNDSLKDEGVTPPSNTSLIFRSPVSIAVTMIGGMMTQTENLPMKITGLILIAASIGLLIWRTRIQIPKREALIQEETNKIFTKSFEDVLMNESMGGNAGLDHAIVNTYMDKNGQLVEFGNIQDLDRSIQDREMAGELFRFGFRVKMSSKPGPLYQAIEPRRIRGLGDRQMPRSLRRLAERMAQEANARAQKSPEMGWMELYSQRTKHQASPLEMDALKKYIDKVQLDKNRYGRTLKLILAVSENDANIVKAHGLTAKMERKMFKEKGVLRSSMLEQFLANADQIDQIVVSARRAEYQDIAQRLKEGIKFEPETLESILNKNADKILTDDFAVLIMNESIGGNAGPGYAIINGYVDKMGHMVNFGNSQNLERTEREKFKKGEIFQFSIKVKVQKMDGPILTLVSSFNGPAELVPLLNDSLTIANRRGQTKISDTYFSRNEKQQQSLEELQTKLVQIFTAYATQLQEIGDLLLQVRTLAIAGNVSEAIQINNQAIALYKKFQKDIQEFRIKNEYPNSMLTHILSHMVITSPEAVESMLHDHDIAGLKKRLYTPELIEEVIGFVRTKPSVLLAKGAVDDAEYNAMFERAKLKAKQTMLSQAQPQPAKKSDPLDLTAEKLILTNGENRKPVILYLEDEDLLRMSNGMMLEDLGFDVLEASNVDEALKYAQDKSLKIDLVLSDVDMDNKGDLPTGINFFETVEKEGNPLIRRWIFMTSRKPNELGSATGKTIVIHKLTPNLKPTLAAAFRHIAKNLPKPVSTSSNGAVHSSPMIWLVYVFSPLFAIPLIMLSHKLMKAYQIHRQKMAATNPQVEQLESILGPSEPLGVGERHVFFYKNAESLTASIAQRFSVIRALRAGGISATNTIIVQSGAEHNVKAAVALLRFISGDASLKIRVDVDDRFFKNSELTEEELMDNFLTKDATLIVAPGDMLPARGFNQYKSIALESLVPPIDTSSINSTLRTLWQALLAA